MPMKACSYLCAALGLVFGLASPNQVFGEVGCFVVEVMMDQHAQSEALADREPASSVHPSGKAKASKHAAQAPASPSIDDQATARTKAFMLGQNPTDYCAGPAPRLPPCAELDFGLFFSSQSAFLPRQKLRSMPPKRQLALRSTIKQRRARRLLCSGKIRRTIAQGRRRAYRRVPNLISVYFFQVRAPFCPGS